MARTYGTEPGTTDIAKTPAGQVVLSGADQLLALANPQRVALHITSIGVGPQYLSFGTAAAVVGSGVKLTSTTPPFSLFHYTGQVRIIGVAAEVVSFSEV